MWSSILVVFVLGVVSGTPNLQFGPFGFQAKLPSTINSKAEINITEDWHTQKLNHFDALDTRTWPQDSSVKQQPSSCRLGCKTICKCTILDSIYSRSKKPMVEEFDSDVAQDDSDVDPDYCVSRYFLTEDYYKEGGPIFLFLAGEWEATTVFFSNTSFMGRLANNHGALAVELEHRYYGRSYPTPDMETPNLRYFTIDQALEDAAQFVEWLRSELGYTGRCVVFGTSYSATLASWARARYPHIFHAAYSSSGPTLIKSDFYEFYEVTGYAMGLSDPDCPLAVTEGMNKLQTLIAEGGASLEYVNELFPLCAPGLNASNPMDVMYLNSVFASFFGSLVQYAGPEGQTQTCDRILNGQGTPLENMVEIMTDLTGGNCLSADHELFTKFYQNLTMFIPQLNLRQLLYQQCTEFGFFYTLSSPNQPFGQLVPVEFFTDGCTKIFGDEFTAELLEAGAAHLNLNYGGLKPDVTRVIFMQGSLDPYFQVSINQTLGPDTPSIVIEGGSHSFEMSIKDELDSPVVVAARALAEQYITEWLALP